MNYAELFDRMHPEFFAREEIRNIPETESFDEMALTLSELDEGSYRKPFGPEVSFGFYTGDAQTLLQAVAAVDEDWVPYFRGSDDVYCAFLNGTIASFCLVEDMGIWELADRTLRIGGPGCVGTLPEYRNRGLGLMMVSNATRILRDRGYDISYIHYTGVAPWYRRLGYETILRWNSRGIRE